MLFAGIASALSKFAKRHSRGELPSQTEQLQCLVVAGYIVAAVWVVLFWPDQNAIAFDPQLTPLLIINTAATTTALLIGNSSILPISTDIEEKGPGSDEEGSYTHDVPSLLALVGIAGCLSALSVRRSYTNWYQLCCFILGVLCIALKVLRGFEDDRKDRHQIRFTTYELLDDTASRTIGEEEAGVPNEASGKVRSGLSTFGGGSPSLVPIRLGVVLLLIWGLYTCLNFSAPQHARHFTLDRDYEPTTPLEVVISMYKEPVEDVRELVSRLKTVPETSGASVTIYIKDKEADTERVRLSIGVDKVIKLPNVGREGETYLNHINNRWDSLAKHTIFLQADIHNPREFYTRLQKYFVARHTGFLSLGWSDVCKCEECGDRFSWSDNAGLFPWYHSKISNSTECRNVLLSYKGQFVVSAARIRGISKMIYNDLWHNFIDENSWAHKPDFLQGRPDSMSAPDFGYTMERMWNLLFQCSDMDIAWKCPTLLSGWRLGGDVEDCQCFDSRPPSDR